MNLQYFGLFHIISFGRVFINWCQIQFQVSEVVPVISPTWNHSGTTSSESEWRTNTESVSLLHMLRLTGLFCQVNFWIMLHYYTQCSCKIKRRKNCEISSKSIQHKSWFLKWIHNTRWSKLRGKRQYARFLPLKDRTANLPLKIDIIIITN